MAQKKIDRAAKSAERLRRMHDRLLHAYGPQGWWPAETAFEVVLGAYLTQNTSWKAVEKSLANLRNEGMLTVEGIRMLSPPALERLIRPSGFHTRKAPALKAFVAMLDAEFEGSLDLLSREPTFALRQRLLSLPGVGFETADAILLYALGHPVPVADEYLRRLAERHDLFPEAGAKGRRAYESLGELVRAAFSLDPAENQRQLFGEFHALVVAVGKRHCAKQAKCSGCPLAADLLWMKTRESEKIN